MEQLAQAAKTVVESHLGVNEDEQVLVICDEPRRGIGLAIFDAAREVGAEALLLEIIERPNHGAPMPDAVAAAMAQADVIIAPTTKSLSHTAARRAASDRGARCASMPLVTEEIMARALRADPGGLKRLGSAYAHALTEGSRVHITAPGGTDVTLDITGREAISDDGDLASEGAFGNLPAGEAFLAPVEGAGEGSIVFDGSLSPDGATDTPVRVELKDGHIVSAEGGPAPGFMALPEEYGQQAWDIAELGIGTNDKAIITGNVLEDEKVASTIHIAFGNNATIGGTNEVASHHDGVVRDATVEIDGEKVLDGGRLLLG